MSRGPRVTTRNRYGEVRGSVADIARRQANRKAKAARAERKTIQADLVVTGGGTVYQVHAFTDRGHAWLAENVDEGEFGATATSRVVEHRYIRDIVAGAQRDGLVVA